MRKKLGILFLIFVFEATVAQITMTEITAACTSFNQINTEALALPDSTCKTNLLGSLSYDINTCSLFSDPVNQNLGQTMLNDVTQRQNELDACKASSPTTAASGPIATSAPTNAPSSAPTTAASCDSALSQAIQDLITLYNTTNSSTVAPNCCSGPIQADINLLIQLSTTYQVNYAANTESITCNFVQGLNSNIQVLKANWTTCETSGLCCNGTSITTTLLPTTSTTVAPTTTSTTSTTTSTTSTTTSTTPTTTSTTVPPTTTSTTSTTIPPTTTSTTSTTTSTTSTTTSTTSTTLPPTTTSTTTLAPTSTTLGPNITACAMTQSYGSSFICFPDATIKFGFNDAGLVCGRLRMSLLAVTTDTELGYFNNFWSSLLNIFASNEFYVNALKNGTFFYTSTGTKITATISGTLGSCLTLKKGLLGLTYTLTAGTCSTAKNFLCQYT